MARTTNVGVLGVRVGAHHVGPGLGAQEEGVLAPRLDAVRGRGGHRPAVVGPRQAAHDDPARRGTATPAIRGRRRPAEGSVLGQTHHIARGPRRVEEREAEAGIEHQHVVSGALPHGFADQQARVGTGRGVGGARRCAPTLPTRATRPTGMAGKALPASWW